MTSVKPARPPARTRRTHSPAHAGRRGSDHRRRRADLLADVAAMYYQQGMLQEAIARRVGLTRSMVSRLLSEARIRGIVEIRIHRPLQFSVDLAAELAARFGLRQAHVIEVPNEGDERLLEKLGQAAAGVLEQYLAPDRIMGVTWGTAVRATVTALRTKDPIPSLKIVQLLGALGGRIEDYDGHALVRTLEAKLGGEGHYINAPFLVSSRQAAADLARNKGIAQTIALAERCDTALLGIGSIDRKYSSFYRAGYVSLRELRSLQAQGAIGDVCGYHFDARGRSVCADFSSRLMGISEAALRAIPARLGVAGGHGKTQALLGALRGGFVSILVTDSSAARELIRLDGAP